MTQLAKPPRPSAAMLRGLLLAVTAPLAGFGGYATWSVLSGML